MRALWSRCAALFRARRLDRELGEEVGFHLAMLEQEYRAKGMGAEAAKLAARREFGGVAQAEEAYRERRGLPWLESAFKDVRYALRGLGRNPGFTAAAVVSLALGIGANTAIFSIVEQVMLRMLPVARPAELVDLYRTGGWGRGFSSYPLYLEIAQRRDLFQGVAARSGIWKQRLSSGSDRVEFAQTEYVTGNYFRLLGVGPALGRVFGDDDNRTPMAHPVAVLSYEFWRNRFGADPRVLGRTVVVDDRALKVIGVAAAGFRGIEVEHHPDVWIPVMMNRGKVMDPGMHWVWLVGRRRPDVSHQRLQAAVDAIMRQYLMAQYRHYPNAAFGKMALQQRLEVQDVGTGISALRLLFGKALMVLLAAVGLVLLAACANLANLLLARGAARRREIALRMSLGATRARLILQALAESLLLSAFGSAAGILFAVWGERAILSFLPAESAEPFALAPDPAVLAFAVGISLAAALLFGLAPAFRSTAVDPPEGLRDGPRQTGGRPALRSALVVAQVALSVVLVALAGLFGGTLAGLRSVDPGFRNTNAIAFELDFPAGWKFAAQIAAHDRLVQRVSELPGVISASYGFPGPFEMGYASATIRVPGSAATAREPAEVRVGSVAPRYFETIGSPLVAGREFDRNDTAVSRKVAVVNEAFARLFFPGIANPVGRILSFDDEKPEGGEPTFIVGVARNIREDGLREAVKPRVYTPASQPSIARGDPVVLVRAQAPPSGMVPALRRELARLGPEVAMTDPRTIERHIDDSIFQERILATLSGFFGALALLLAGVGLYGVVAYGTARRAAEIGVRIALGATGGNVLWMVLRDALLLVAIGLAAGIPLSMAATRVIASVLAGIEPAGALTFAGTACLLLGVGVAAALFPARRAAATDPMRALRVE
jgi:predicted permease